MKKKTIVFIHGMFMTSLCWEDWTQYFGSKGYKTLALDWPGRDLGVEQLRRKNPDPELGKLTLSQVLDYYENYIQKLDDKPIIIGHSMGALVTQVLLNRSLGAAAVAIDSAPPAGVFSPKWSFLKSNFPMISPFASKSQPHLMTFKQFQYAFVNTLPLSEQHADYDRYVVPESRQVPRESLTATAKIDFHKEHEPLLMIAGAEDHIIPASLVQSNYKKYDAPYSVVDFLEFPGRVHFLIGQKGWQEIADAIDGWLKQQDL